MNELTPEERQRWVERQSESGRQREAWRGVMCLLRWLEIREENALPTPNTVANLIADLQHSRLFRRLLDGKEPLQHAPPTAYGYPWHELVETGRGRAFEVYEDEGAPPDEPRILISRTPWTVLEKRSEREYVVAYRTGGEPYRLTEVTDGSWELVQM